MRKYFWTKAILIVVFLYAMLMTYNTMLGDPRVPAWAKLTPVFFGFLILFWWCRSWLVPAIGQTLKVISQALGYGLFFLAFGLRRWHGARYMAVWERWFFLSRRYKGWLVDGKQKRLSAKVSFQSIKTIAPVGAGKTTIFALPNLFTLDQCSMIITDIKGTAYDLTSGYLKRKGFEIKVLNLIELDRSHGFNPLQGASSFNDISKLAHLLMTASGATGKDGDPFWINGAEKIIRILIQCLKNRSQDEDCTLSRVKELLSDFDHYTAEPGQSKLDRWVLESTLNDPTTWREYKSFIAGPEKTVMSFISTADVALMSLGNVDLAQLLSSHDFDFAALRQRKTALYVRVRPQDMGTLSFVISAFYTQLFNTLMSEVNPRHLPVYAILDEFGNMKIPNFPTIAATAREYKLAFWLFLQSDAQLQAQYGSEGAKSISDSIGTEIYLAGAGQETVERLSRKLGQTRTLFGQKDKPLAERNLMNPDEVRTMWRSEAILIHGNQYPLRYWIKPYYQHGRFSRYAKIPPVELPHLQMHRPPTPEPGFKPPPEPPEPTPPVNPPEPTPFPPTSANDSREGENE